MTFVIRFGEPDGSSAHLSNSAGVLDSIAFDLKATFLAIVLAFVGVLSSAQANAQNVYYVRSGAIGANNGSNWTDAFSTLPAALVRGAKYYIADGNYASYTFDDPVSGTSQIMVTKCTQSDHGADVGYVSGFCDGQAAFSGVTFATGFYLFDGQVRNEGNWQETAAYGFRINPFVTVNPSVSNVSLKYSDIGGTQVYPNDAAKGLALNVGAAPWRENLTFSRLHIHHARIPIHSRNTNSLTLEYSHIGPGFGKEAISHQYGHNWVIRWNKFVDSCVFPTDEGCTATIGVFNYTGGGDPALAQSDNWGIYGNVFALTGKYSAAASDGLIVGNVVNNWKIYNNTFSRVSGNWGGALMLSGTGNSMRNNLWYWMGDYTSDTNYGSMILASGADNSWCFYKNSHPARVGRDCSVLTGAKSLGIEDPFINEVGGDYRLKGTFSGASPLNKGANLGAPYNVDMFGNARGADGYWDIGAFEGGGGNTVTPAAPTDVSVDGP